MLTESIPNLKVLISAHISLLLKWSLYLSQNTSLYRGLCRSRSRSRSRRIRRRKCRMCSNTGLGHLVLFPEGKASGSRMDTREAITSLGPFWSPCSRKSHKGLCACGLSGVGTGVSSDSAKWVPALALVSSRPAVELLIGDGSNTHFSDVPG